MDGVFLHGTPVLIKCDDEQKEQKIQHNNKTEFVPVIVPSSSN